MWSLEEIKALRERAKVSLEASRTLRDQAPYIVDTLLETIALLGSRRATITPAMQQAMDECVQAEENGQSKDCLGCPCNVCVLHM